jgi:hypothetical protein
MDPYMASNGSCFMVTWTICKNQLWEVGLTQNWETMALRTLITVELFYFYHVWGPAWIEIHWNSIWLRVQSHMIFTLLLRVRDHITWFWRCVGTTFGHFHLGSHNFMVMAHGHGTWSWHMVMAHGHGTWFMCEVALTYIDYIRYCI